LWTGGRLRRTSRPPKEGGSRAPDSIPHADGEGKMASIEKRTEEVGGGDGIYQSGKKKQR